MASFDPQTFGFEEPPPRPTTPPVRRGFLLVLLVLCLMAGLVYGVPYVARRAGYAWEAGRSQAASEALARLDKAGIVNRSSELFRMATAAVAPAVVRIETREFEPAGTNLGSGVIIDKDRGFIVTNNHVVKGADEIQVSLSRGVRLRARLVGADPKTDLAVIQAQGHFLTAAEWGDSDKLDIGDWVLAIGSPFALDHTVTAGIVSATQRNDLRINEYESFIQTDASINPGNSGGPLIDLRGKVIGINTAIYTSNQSMSNEGIGLAIPSSMAKHVVESLIKEGRVVRGFLGVEIEEVTPASAKELGVPDEHGVLVTRVRPNSPAANAGLQAGDVIIKLAGRDVTSPLALRNLTARLAVGSNVSLSYYRKQASKNVDVTIAEFPTAPELDSLGFRLRELPPAEAQGHESAVEVDQVLRDSPASRAGLRPGMAVLAVGRTRVRNKAEYEAALATIPPGQPLPLIVQRADGQAAPIIIGNPPPPARQR